MYKCEICNQAYGSPVERSLCVLKCERERKNKEVAAARITLNKERAASRDNIRAKTNELTNLIDEHNKKFSETLDAISYLPTKLHSSIFPSRFPAFEFMGLI